MLFRCRINFSSFYEYRILSILCVLSCYLKYKRIESRKTKAPNTHTLLTSSFPSKCLQEPAEALELNPDFPCSCQGLNYFSYHLLPPRVEGQEFLLEAEEPGLKPGNQIRCHVDIFSIVLPTHKCLVHNYLLNLTISPVRSYLTPTMELCLTRNKPLRNTDPEHEDCEESINTCNTNGK